MAERPRPSMERPQAEKKTVVRKSQKPRQAPKGKPPVQAIDYDYERSVKFANRGCLLAFTTAIAAAAVVLLVGFLYIKGELDGGRAAGESAVVLEVPGGSTRAEIADLLKANGLISNVDIFKLYTRFNGSTGFLSGRYSLTPGMSYDEIIAVLTQAPEDREVITVTFGPGQTVYEFGRRCEEAGLGFTAEEFVEAAQNEDFSDISIFQYIDADPNTYMKLEGYLAPDTYDFYSDVAPATVIRRLLEQFNSIITRDDLDRMEAQGLSLREAMTLASIIEKEASYPDIENQGLVAGVFWNRLTKDNEEIPRKTLGSDATYYYLRNWVAPAFGGEESIPRNIYDAYVTSDNYEQAVSGIPAGPICNPSASALEAAIWPAQHDDFYFLTDDGGLYYYAGTYREHERNMADAEVVNEQLAAAAAASSASGSAAPEGEDEETAGE